MLERQNVYPFILHAILAAAELRTRQICDSVNIINNLTFMDGN
jgi:hypothetical protein